MLTPMGIRKLARRLLICLAASFVLALAGEGLLRVTDHHRLAQVNPALFVEDEDLGYRKRPNVRVYSSATWFETNAAGLRGPHWNDVHAEGKRCVLFSGHSIMAGVGAEEGETLPARFTTKNDHGLVGINFGHVAYRYDQELPLALAYVDEIRPAASVVMFTGNDFSDRFDPFQVVQHTDRARVPIPGKAWLRKNSVCYDYLRRQWNRALLATGIRKTPARREMRIDADDERSRQCWQEYEEYLVKLKLRSNAPLILTAFPVGQTESSYKQLRGIADRHGFPFVSFEHLWDSEQDYLRHGALPYDEHPNMESLDVMAEELLRAVEAALGSTKS